MKNNKPLTKVILILILAIFIFIQCDPGLTGESIVKRKTQEEEECFYLKDKNQKKLTQN